MTSTTGWNSSTTTGVPGNDQSLNNDSGFNAFPEGYRFSGGSFGGEGGGAYLWSSTGGSSDDSPIAWGRDLGYYYSILSRNNNGKLFGFSVRLVKD